MSKFIENALKAIGLHDADLKSVAAIVKGHLDRYADEEIVRAWVRTLPIASVGFNPDPQHTYNGVYWVKHGETEYDCGVYFSEVRTVVRSEQLYPVWVGEANHRPIIFDNIYTIVDVPQSFKDRYK